MPKLWEVLHDLLEQDNVRPISAHFIGKTPSDFLEYLHKKLNAPGSVTPRPQRKDVLQKVADFFHVRIICGYYPFCVFDHHPSSESGPLYYFTPTENYPLPIIVLSKGSFDQDLSFDEDISGTVYSLPPIPPPPSASFDSSVDDNVESSQRWLDQLMFYPHGFERFYKVLKSAFSRKLEGDEPSLKDQEHKLKCAVGRHLEDIFSRNPKQREIFQNFPAHKFFLDGYVTKLLVPDDTRRDPFTVLETWLKGHSKMKKHDCKNGLRIVENFIHRKSDSFENMCALVQTQCALHECGLFHFSTSKPLSDLDKQMHVFVEENSENFKQHRYMRIADVLDKKNIWVQAPFNNFLSYPNLAQTACIFEGVGSKTLFDISKAKGSPMSVLNFASMQQISSIMTARWLRHKSGHTLKIWAHMPKYEHEKCEVEKCSDPGEKWRHMIFSYAIMALSWNEFNGNKEGPVGFYPSRSAQEIGSVTPIVKKTYGDNCGVYASKTGGLPVDYNGHNIVALAVGKRGEILRVSYNHNTLFNSTVDHAEERLIDGLYRDPKAFVPESTSQMFDSSEKLVIEKYMQHISVYTSLEPCQQCSGKMHLALIPEVISCQRDWDIHLLGDQLYQQFHKCRPILASYFDFSPYDELGRKYMNFCQRVSQEKISFFEKHGSEPTVAKATMPYFLCTDEAQAIFKRGSEVFTKIFSILFAMDQKDRPSFDNDCDFFREDGDRKVTVVEKDRLELLELFDLDVSQWITSKPDSDSKSDDIRRFRPSLSDKQKRILHDELLYYRRKWTSLIFKKICSLTFFFDRNCIITENDIENRISPLGDISSIELSRDVQGSLIGSFIVTFSSSDAPREIKQVFDKISFDEHDNQGLLFTEIAGVSPSKVKLFRDASIWLHSIRKPHPSQVEIFIPTESITDDHRRECQEKHAIFLIENNTHKALMARSWPLFKSCMPISVVRCPNVASARWLTQRLPNYDSPNCTRVLLSFFEGIVGCRYQDVTSVMPPDDRRFTVSLIARNDVTEANLLNQLQTCILTERGHTPKYLRVLSSSLYTCNSNKYLSWLHIDDCRSDKVIEPRLFAWKLWQIQCFASTKVSLDAQKLKSLPHEKFCQPYPQSVFDAAICRVASGGQNEHFEVHSDFWLEPSRMTNPEKTNTENMSVLLKIRNVQTDRKTKTNLFWIEFDDKNRKVVQVFPLREFKDDKKIEIVKIDLEKSSFATLVCTNMLNDFRLQIENLFRHLLSKPSNETTDDADFWGLGFKLTVPPAFTSTFIKLFFDIFLSIKRGNLFRFRLKKILTDTDREEKTIDLGLWNSAIRLIDAKLLPKLPAKFSSTLRYFCDSPSTYTKHFCPYCGIYFEFPCLVDGPICSDSVQCIQHLKQGKQDDIKHNVGQYVTHLELTDVLKGSTSELESHDPAKNMNPRTVLDQVKTLEAKLQLQTSVENLFFPFEWYLRYYKVASLCPVITGSDDQLPAAGSLSLALRRDEYHKPAHILFCFSVPVPIACDIYLEIAIPNPNHSERIDPIYCSQKADIVQQDIPKPIQDKNLLKDPRDFFLSKNEYSKIFGRLSCNVLPKLNEGGAIPAICLRKFLEPEYFPELFLPDFKVGSHPTRPFYPTLNFLSKATDSPIKFVSVQSFDFTESQTSELKQILICQKQLKMHEIEVSKLESDIRLIRNSISSIDESIESVIRDLQRQKPQLVFDQPHFFLGDTKSETKGIFEFKTMFVRFPLKTEYTKLQVPFSLSEETKQRVNRYDEPTKWFFRQRFREYCKHKESGDTSTPAPGQNDAPLSRDEKTALQKVSDEKKAEKLSNLISAFVKVLNLKKLPCEQIESLKSFFKNYRETYRKAKDKNLDTDAFDELLSKNPILLKILQFDNIHTFYRIQDRFLENQMTSDRFPIIFSLADTKAMLKACCDAFQLPLESTCESTDWLNDLSFCDNIFRTVLNTLSAEEFYRLDSPDDTQEVREALSALSRDLDLKISLSSKLSRWEQKHIHLLGNELPLPNASKFQSLIDGAVTNCIKSFCDPPSSLAVASLSSAPHALRQPAPAPTAAAAAAPAPAPPPPPRSQLPPPSPIQTLETFKFFLQEDQRIFEQVELIP
jgi:tRNA(Arg) A34 adenosine deaminase TadA